MPGVRCPLGKWERVQFRCDRCGSAKFDERGLKRCPACSSPPQVVLPQRRDRELEDTAIITFHFNFNRARRLRETYDEWRPTVGHPVMCYELVIGDDEPEVIGSVVARGDERHLLWQKERLINLAIDRLPEHIRYVAWLDHDMVFEDDDWLQKSIDLLDSGVDAVQPFSHIDYLDLGRRVLYRRKAMTVQYLQGNADQTCPGAAWVTTRDLLRRTGGLYDRNIVGGGDAVWFAGLTGHEMDFLGRQPPKTQADARRWIAAIQADGPARIANLDGRLWHLWHGDRKHRQYVSRDAILRQFDFDPQRHIEADPSNGLHRFSAAAPAGLPGAIREFFRGRREDG